jgi:uncharacterized NAD-dependent epimerase/dehydratase family protein
MLRDAPTHRRRLLGPLLGHPPSNRFGLIALKESLPDVVVLQHRDVRGALNRSPSTAKVNIRLSAASSRLTVNGSIAEHWQ